MRSQPINGFMVGYLKLEAIARSEQNFAVGNSWGEWVVTVIINGGL